jgi:hypothetical protein
MKAFLLFCLLNATNILAGYARAAADTCKPATLGGTVGLASNGFAPVPIFMFNSPLLNASVTVKKSRFSFETCFSTGLNMRHGCIVAA